MSQLNGAGEAASRQLVNATRRLDKLVKDSRVYPDDTELEDRLNEQLLFVHRLTSDIFAWSEGREG